MAADVDSLVWRQRRPMEAGLKGPSLGDFPSGVLHH